MMSVLREWFYEGIAFVRDIWSFFISTFYSGTIVWVIALGIGILIYWRFFRK
jgi:hypothetical protein